VQWSARALRAAAKEPEEMALDDITRPDDHAVLGPRAAKDMAESLALRFT
jgi:hypothetical protein